MPFSQLLSPDGMISNEGHHTSSTVGKNFIAEAPCQKLDLGAAGLLRFGSKGCGRRLYTKLRTVGSGEEAAT
jgi:hypothetical protein